MKVFLSCTPLAIIVSFTVWFYLNGIKKRDPTGSRFFFLSMQDYFTTIV